MLSVYRAFLQVLLSYIHYESATLIVALQEDNSWFRPKDAGCINPAKPKKHTAIAVERGVERKWKYTGKTFCTAWQGYNLSH